MKSLRRAPAAEARSGFTLAEVAVTLVIVGMTLLLVLEGLSMAKLTAAHSSNRKVARDLALMTLGWVESGLFWEDLDGLPGTITGNYAEEGYEAFSWELAVGDEGLSSDSGDGAYFDSVAYERQRRLEERERQDQEDAEPWAETGSTGAPYEVVAVRVTFPKLGDEENVLQFERWIPLEQVFGRPEGQFYGAEEGSE